MEDGKEAPEESMPATSGPARPFSPSHGALKRHVHHEPPLLVPLSVIQGACVLLRNPSGQHVSRRLTRFLRLSFLCPSSPQVGPGTDVRLQWTFLACHRKLSLTL
jgi:hypothetical protein